MSEFVQSNEMVSRVIAMVSEDRSVNAILEELLGGDGCGIQLKDPTPYMHPNEELSFLQLSKRVHQYDMVCLGYRESEDGDPEHQQTVINPRDKNTARSWAEATLIVLTGSPMHPHLHNGGALADTGVIKH